MKIKSIIYSLIIVAIGFAACQKDDLNQNSSLNEPTDFNWGLGDSIPIYSQFYFLGKVDGTFLVIQDSLQGKSAYVDSVSYAPCVSDTDHVVGQIAGLADTLTGEGLVIRFLNCIPDSTDSLANSELITQRTYPFGSSDVFNLIEGVEVSWKDNSGTVWTSRSGTGANQNFSFEIIELFDHAPLDSLSDYYAKGRMDLVLYDGPNSIKVEAGEFNLRVGKF